MSVGGEVPSPAVRKPELLCSPVLLLLMPEDACKHSYTNIASRII